jgi:hypothetical protein
MTKKKIEYWVIPPEADAEFVANMEDVLDVYSRPYDARVPVLCMDEQPVQLLKETRIAIAASREHPKRVDYENEWTTNTNERARQASSCSANPFRAGATSRCGTSSGWDDFVNLAWMDLDSTELFHELRGLHPVPLKDVAYSYICQFAT